jgi:hypothetical protein
MKVMLPPSPSTPSSEAVVSEEAPPVPPVFESLDDSLPLHPAAMAAVMDKISNVLISLFFISFLLIQ